MWGKATGLWAAKKDHWTWNKETFFGSLFMTISRLLKILLWRSVMWEEKCSFRTIHRQKTGTVKPSASILSWTPQNGRLYGNATRPAGDILQIPQWPCLLHVHLHLHLSHNSEGHWGTTDDFTTIFLQFFSVLHCPLGLGESHASPFPHVFPPILLSALSSSPFHCALRYGFGQT